MARRQDTVRILVQNGRRVTLTRKADFLPEDVLMVFMKHHIMTYRSDEEIEPVVLDRAAKALLVFGE